MCQSDKDWQFFYLDKKKKLKKEGGGGRKSVNLIQVICFQCIFTLICVSVCVRVCKCVCVCMGERELELERVMKDK